MVQLEAQLEASQNSVEEAVAVNLEEAESERDDEVSHLGRRA